MDNGPPESVAAATSVSGVNADNTFVQVAPVVFTFRLGHDTSVINVSQNWANSTGGVGGSSPSTDQRHLTTVISR